MRSDKYVWRYGGFSKQCREEHTQSQLGEIKNASFTRGLDYNWLSVGANVCRCFHIDSKKN